MELYVIPEVERRLEGISDPEPYRIQQAQVVLPPDDKPGIVRLNDEIRGSAQVILSKGVVLQPGTPVTVGDIEGIEAFSLDPEEDPDCGHITMLAVASGWRIRFDFRRNRELANRHLAVAREFLEAAQGALAREHYGPLVDTLFSACELAAKAQLLAFPDPEFRVKATHSAIKSRFNKAAEVGNANREHSIALNRLSKLRKSARYLRSELKIDKEEGEGLHTAVESLIEAVSHFFGEGSA